MWSLALALTLNTPIALLARRRRSLSLSGAWAALGVGTAVFYGAGLALYVPLLFFFASSTALGKVGRARKAALKRDFEKGDERDAWQVLANGGISAACALLASLNSSSAHPLYLAALGALATANADTWATELGPLSRARPLDLRSLRPTPAGTSGAVSWLGLLVTIIASACVGACALPFADASQVPGGPWQQLGIITLAGSSGAFVDSLLGAWVQAAYHCPTCDVTCEGPNHHCGTATRRVSGLAAVNNDVVNCLATLCGAAVAGALATALAAGPCCQ